MHAPQRRIVGQHAGRRIGHLLLHAAGRQGGQVPFAGVGAAGRNSTERMLGSETPIRQAPIQTTSWSRAMSRTQRLQRGSDSVVHLEHAADVRERDAVAADDAGNRPDLVRPCPSPGRG